MSATRTLQIVTIIIVSFAVSAQASPKLESQRNVQGPHVGNSATVQQHEKQVNQLQNQLQQNQRNSKNNVRC